MAMTTEREKQVYQPLHPNIRSKLYPEYVKVHDEIIQYEQPLEARLWTPALRTNPSPIAFAAQTLVDVGKVVDKDIDNYQVRILVPEGDPPTCGWPCLVWYHGGGWVFGGLASENGFLRHICKYVGCVVVSINYRHAPEHAYPAAVDDSYAGLKWVFASSSVEDMQINTSRLAVGGLSAGGGLAAICAMKAALDPDIASPPVFQLLVCPVIDNSATAETGWASSQHSPFLTPTRMTWYRNQYFKNQEDVTNWDASPCFAPPEVLKKSPKTFFAIAECDLLAPEALSFDEQLRKEGVKTEVKVYQGATHSILLFAGIHKVAQDLVQDASFALAQALETSYDRSTSLIVN